MVGNQEQYIFAETFEGGKICEWRVFAYFQREGGTVPSLEGMARFLPMYER